MESGGSFMQNKMISRRNFLKVATASATVAAAGCLTPAASACDALQAGRLFFCNLREENREMVGKRKNLKKEGKKC